MATYITSDTHFHHANIIKYTGRTFCLSPSELALFEAVPRRFKNRGWLKEDVKHIKISKESVERHDATLVNNWNARVTNDDIVWHDGDFLFGDETDVEVMMDRLNFKELNFVFGNHDKPMRNFFKKHGNEVLHKNKRIINRGKLVETTIEKQDVVFCHYPMVLWESSHYGAIHLFGHCHHSLEDNPKSLSIDVGVDGDGYNYSPLRFNEVMAIMQKKTPDLIDLRGREREVQ